MGSLADYEAIDPEERLRRIGRLFCKAAVLALARKDLEGVDGGSSVSIHPEAENGHEPNDSGSLTAEGFELLRRARGPGGIAPREASRLWKVSRATAYRRLSSLERRGWIVRTGATTAARYVVTRKALDSLKEADSASGRKPQ